MIVFIILFAVSIIGLAMAAVFYTQGQKIKQKGIAVSARVVDIEEIKVYHGSTEYFPTFMFYYGSEQITVRYGPMKGKYLPTGEVTIYYCPDNRKTVYFEGDKTLRIKIIMFAVFTVLSGLAVLHYILK